MIYLETKKYMFLIGTKGQCLSHSKSVRILNAELQGWQTYTLSQEIHTTQSFYL